LLNLAGPCSGALHEALAAVKADVRRRQARRDWLPALEYPFTTKFTTE
jgi:hypothetical protein